MKGKKPALALVVAIIVLSWPVFPAWAQEEKECPAGCVYIPEKDRGSQALCPQGCYEPGGQKCCESIEVPPKKGVKVNIDPCFIVTASGQSGQNLSELYWFRDKVLARTLGGRGLLFFYYNLGVGRKLAPVVEESPRLAKVIRAATGATAKIISHLH